MTEIAADRRAARHRTGRGASIAVAAAASALVGALEWSVPAPQSFGLALHVALDIALGVSLFVGASWWATRGGGHVKPADSPNAEAYVIPEQFRLMVQSVRDYAIFMLDREGRVKTWNIGAQGIKGYTADEIIGRPISVFYSAEEQDKPARGSPPPSPKGAAKTKGGGFAKTARASGPAWPSPPSATPTDHRSASSKSRAI